MPQAYLDVNLANYNAGSRSAEEKKFLLHWAANAGSLKLDIGSHTWLDHVIFRTVKREGLRGRKGVLGYEYVAYA